MQVTDVYQGYQNPGGIWDSNSTSADPGTVEEHNSAQQHDQHTYKQINADSGLYMNYHDGLRNSLKTNHIKIIV